MNDPEQPDEYELVEPFDIDDGSLSNLTPELAFALGVEWAIWRAKISGQAVKTDYCLGPNANRIIKILERHHYFCEDRPISMEVYGKACAQWRQIWVGDKIEKL